MSQLLFTDEKIIACLLSDDRRQHNEAVNYLWRRYDKLVKNLVYIYSGEPGIVPTVLHDATAELVLKIRQGVYDPGKSALQTYFYGIAKNILLKILRERDAARTVPLSQLPPDFTKIVENELEEALNTKENKARMDAAIGQLGDNCRQVLIQFYLEEKSMLAIAEALGKTEENVRQLRHRCMEKLREIFNKI